MCMYTWYTPFMDWLSIFFCGPYRSEESSLCAASSPSWLQQTISRFHLMSIDHRMGQGSQCQPPAVLNWTSAAPIPSPPFFGRKQKNSWGVEDVRWVWKLKNQVTLSHACSKITDLLWFTSESVTIRKPMIFASIAQDPRQWAAEASPPPDGSECFRCLWFCERIWSWHCLRRILWGFKPGTWPLHECTWCICCCYDVLWLVRLGGLLYLSVWAASSDAQRHPTAPFIRVL